MRRVEKLLRIARNAQFVRVLVKHRVAAATEHRAVLRGLGCNAVVDIGANRGQFSLMAREAFPDATIFAFEPLTEPAKVCRRVFESDNNIGIYSFAIGDRAEQAVMHVSARDDSSSLLPIGNEQSQIFPGTQEVGTVTVNVRRLEDIISRDEIRSPALLKLDVQGFELEALRGCERLLPEFAWVYCECSFVSLYDQQALAGDVITWLAERNFQLIGVYNMTYAQSGMAVQGDFLFGLYHGCSGQ